MIVGTDRKEVLDYLQKQFAREFRILGMLKESDRLLSKYEVKQAWTRNRIHIKKYPNDTNSKGVDLSPSPAMTDYDEKIWSKGTIS